MNKITEQTKVGITSDQVSSEFLDGELVILGLKEGTYYGLNQVGARVWQVIEKPVFVKDLVDKLIEEYDVPRETCTAEVLNLLQELAAQGLIDIHNDPSA